MRALVARLLARVRATVLFLTASLGCLVAAGWTWLGVPAGLAVLAFAFGVLSWLTDDGEGAA